MAVPPCLAHLVIYNPTLEPPAPTDDEDVREHAHICFYTSRESAVSRDRMLRQVGLAKALVNFTGMFTPEVSSTNVHSQKKRLITFSPEMDWWIHATFDLERVPRTTAPAPKLKDKAKEKVPEKIEYEYIDTLNDGVLREYLLRGYEEFKLVYGSLTEILASKGKPALERELERFFTVWAWRWDLTSMPQFLSHLLCTPLHPLYTAVPPLLAPLEAQVDSGTEILLMSPPFLLYPTTPSFPPSLPAHLISLLPPPPPPRPPSPTPAPNTASNSTGDLSLLSGLALPKKWSWPGVLSFGRSNGRSQRGKADSSLPSTPRVTASDKEERTSFPVTPLATESEMRLEDSATVDKDALVDALQEGEQMSKADEAGAAEQSAASEPAQSAEDADLSKAQAALETILAITTTEAADVANHEKDPPDSEDPPALSGIPLTPFTALPVHLQIPGSSSTRAANILHLTSEGLILALIPPADQEDVTLSGHEDTQRHLEEAGHACIYAVRRALDDPSNATEDPPAAVNMLHIIHRPFNNVALASPVPPNSPLLLEVESQLHSSNVKQSLSRGALHWMVGERREDGGISEDVYVEIERRDLNLTEAEKAAASLPVRIQTKRQGEAEVAAEIPSSSIPISSIEL